MTKIFLILFVLLPNGQIRLQAIPAASADACIEAERTLHDALADKPEASFVTTSCIDSMLSPGMLLEQGA